MLKALKLPGDFRVGVDLIMRGFPHEHPDKKRCGGGLIENPAVLVAVGSNWAINFTRFARLLSRLCLGRRLKTGWGCCVLPRR